MFIFWEECKYLLRSRILWAVVLLGALACAFFSYTNWDFNRESFELSHGFAQEHGLSFGEEDVEAYASYYTEHSKEGQALGAALKKAGLEKLTFQEIQAYQKGEAPEISQKLEKLYERSEEDYWTVVRYIDALQQPWYLFEDNSIEKIRPSQWSENRIDELENRTVPLNPGTKEKLTEAFQQLENRLEEIRENGENHQFLPLGRNISGNSSWFESQFCSMGLGFLWLVAFAAAGVAAGRSLGGSFLSHMQGTIYTGKPGRRLAMRKLLAVLCVSGGIYLLLNLMLTVFYIFLFRLDLYWSVPLASMVSWSGTVVTRFPITVGGFWWFQLGVGLAAVLILALFFSASTVLTKSFYAGAGISVGFSLLLLGIIQMIPAAQNSLLLMGSPMGLYLNAGKFLQREFLFSILPHFEGISLLVWGSLAAVFAALGFVRFRKATL